MTTPSSPSSPAPPVPADGAGRYAEARRVTLVGAAVDLALGVSKLLGGWLASSQALMADGVHSLSDLATDAMVLWAAKHSHAEADAEHPYGHRRIETVVTVGLGLVLLLVGLGIGFDSVRRLFRPETLSRPEILALVIASLSVLAKELVYHYTMRAARRLRSRMLKANAWHSRSDAASSVVVIVGVGGTLLGLEYLDAVAAMVVAWMVAQMGVGLAWGSVRELIDTGLEPDQVAEIRNEILAVDGVEDLHMLRTRQMGGRALVDVHVMLTHPWLSASEAHLIGERVRLRLIERIDDVEDVTVHVDPEDDEQAALTQLLEPRRRVLERLGLRWAEIPGAGEIRHVTLHYLDGRIHVEVELPTAVGRSPEDIESLTRRFREAVKAEPDVADVRLLFSSGPARQSPREARDGGRIAEIRGPVEG